MSGSTSLVTGPVSLLKDPLTINAPATVTIPPAAIAGISLAESGTPPGELFVAALSDVEGMLTASAAGGASVNGSGTDVLTITGSLDQVNAALATLTDTDIDSEPLTINAADTLSNTATQQVAVNFNPIPLPATPANFTVDDTTNGISGTSAGEPYTGPVVGITTEIIIATSDNINVTANIPNVFIHTGSGEDALQALSGTNVLDGSTGSNFLVGGTGSPATNTDTFFLDDRANSPTPPGITGIWSTVVNFHSGDNATVWGVTPKDFITMTNNLGAAGATGLTWDFQTGGTDAKLTLAGYTKTGQTSPSTIDVTNAQGAATTLSLFFGATSAANYMLIHAT